MTGMTYDIAWVHCEICLGFNDDGNARDSAAWLLKWQHLPEVKQAKTDFNAALEDAGEKVRIGE